MVLGPESDFESSDFRTCIMNALDLFLSQL